MDESFIHVKEALANVMLLCIPVVDATLALTTYASNTAKGAVLEQQIGGSVDYFATSEVKEKEDGIMAYKTRDINLKLKDISLGLGKSKLWCEVSTGNARPVVPVAWRRQIFDSFHGLSHPAIRAMKRLIASKKRFGNGLVSAKPDRSEIYMHVKTQLANFSIPSEFLKYINLDIVCPVPQSKRMGYLLTMVDRFTRWAEPIPIADISTQTCARAFVGDWVICSGKPYDIS
ncbi:hypothetical protein RF11_09329 [Thelohanellus kitauei]|uniref:Integrase catalytic domain-containing protein n=1 Tax=Thelohanellus kitauei TaxID=669202 RepID=A0A0C2JC51_THEKT|nr:hypothetical protein RF11_09329 [Thelohanellus kitauei]